MITATNIIEQLEGTDYLTGSTSNLSMNRWRIVKEDPNTHPSFQFTIEKRNKDGVYVFKKSYKTYQEALQYVRDINT